MYDYENDTFEDIISKDPRYDARAYTMLLDVLDNLFDQHQDGKTNVTATEIMDDFRDAVLDDFGPLSYTVLQEWGLTRCEDIGEMMFNLCDSGRVQRSEEDTKECFNDGYDFRETFLMPYEPR